MRPPALPMLFDRLSEPDWAELEVMSSDEEEELEECDEIDEGPALGRLFTPVGENPEGGMGRWYEGRLGEF